MAVRIQPTPGTMAAGAVDLPAFPNELFGFGFPEAIGDAAAPRWFNDIAPVWTELPEGVWQSVGGVPGEVAYTLTVTPGADYVDLQLACTNESERPWAQSMAFNCFQCGAASVADHECARHWCRPVGGDLTRLVAVPRRYGPRPTVQLYGVAGAPAPEAIPFVAGFQATLPDTVLEGWLAIVHPDGERLAAVVSKPALFLFQNMEYSCIHSAAGFGPLAPGQTGEATTRAYMTAMSLEAWYARMRAEGWLGGR